MRRFMSYVCLFVILVATNTNPVFCQPSDFLENLYFPAEWDLETIQRIEAYLEQFSGPRNDKDSADDNEEVFQDDEKDFEDVAPERSFKSGSWFAKITKKTKKAAKKISKGLDKVPAVLNKVAEKTSKAAEAMIATKEAFKETKRIWKQ